MSGIDMRRVTPEKVRRLQRTLCSRTGAFVSVLTQSDRCWYEIVPRRVDLRRTGCSVSQSVLWSNECERLKVKPVREPDYRNGQLRFDERTPQTESWRGLRQRGQITKVLGYGYSPRPKTTVLVFDSMSRGCSTFPTGRARMAS